MKDNQFIHNPPQESLQYGCKLIDLVMAVEHTKNRAPCDEVDFL